MVLSCMCTTRMVSLEDRFAFIGILHLITVVEEMLK